MAVPPHHAIGPSAADAIRDCLVDARCALRDGKPSYAMACIRQAEELAKLPTSATYHLVSDILMDRPKS